MEEENIRDSRIDIRTQKTVKTMEVEESEIADFYDGFGEDESQKDEDILSVDKKFYSVAKPKIRSDINKYAKKNALSRSSSKNLLVAKRNKFREVSMSS